MIKLRRKRGRPTYLMMSLEPATFHGRKLKSHFSWHETGKVNLDEPIGIFSGDREIDVSWGLN